MDYDRSDEHAPEAPLDRGDPPAPRRPGIALRLGATVLRAGARIVAGLALAGLDVAGAALGRRRMRQAERRRVAGHVRTMRPSARGAQ